MSAAPAPSDVPLQRPVADGATELPAADDGAASARPAEAEDPLGQPSPPSLPTARPKEEAEAVVPESATPVAEPISDAASPAMVTEPVPAPNLAALTDLDTPPASVIPPGYVRVERPRGSGVGLMWASIASFSLGVTFQIGDTVVCGNCAYGGIERAFFATAIATATGAGFRRGRQDAYQDAARQHGMRNGRRALVAGAVLLGVGVAAGLINEGFWWRCQVERDGPYEVDRFDPALGFNQSGCRYGVGRSVLNLSVLSTSVGGALLGWAIRYRSDATSYRRAHIVSVAPQLSQRSAGLQLGGAF